MKTPSIVAAGTAAMSDDGGSSRVHTTGVGAPRSLRMVTIASPMPSCVRSSSRS